MTSNMVLSYASAMRPHRKASGTARGEGLRGPAPLDSPPDAKAEPWNHHAVMTSPQGSPHPPRHPAQENGRNRSARVRDPCRAPYGSRCHGSVDPFRTRFRQCFPIARAVGALHGVSPPPTHGGLRPGNGARSAARALRIFFWTVRLCRIDHTGVAPPVNVAASPHGFAPVL